MLFAINIIHLKTNFLLSWQQLGS